MKYKVVISSEVTAEILSASSYYDGIREGLGQDLEKEIEAALDYIANNPLLYPREFGPVHRALVRRFNQVLFYIVRGEYIVILEMRDTRREPPDWTARGFKKN